MDERQFLTMVEAALELGPGSVTLATRFRQELDWDSLLGFSLLNAIEQEQGVEVPVATFMTQQTLGDVFAFVQAAKK